MSNILLIEDNKNNADIMIRILSRNGHEVVHTAEGLTGLNIAATQQIDIILVDLGLPDVGGATVIALLKRIPNDIPIVVITASTDYAEWQQAANRGSVGCITKPINTRSFANEIESFLSRYPQGDVQRSINVISPPILSSEAHVSTLF